MLRDDENESMKRLLKAAEISQQTFNEMLAKSGGEGLTAIEMLDGMLSVVLANKQQLEGTPKVVSAVYMTLCMMNEAAGIDGLVYQSCH